MKYGNFVGKKNLPFTDKEKSDILYHFSILADKLIPDLKRVYIYVPGDPEVRRLLGDSLIIAVVRENHTGRNKFGSRIFGHDGFMFHIHKQSGYLEVRNGETDPDKFIRDYDNAPEFSYGCTMTYMGMEIPYRCRVSRSIKISGSPYTYGTEISDLDYEDYLKRAVEYTEIVKK